MNEFRRLINRKVVIGFIALLVINVSLYVYQQTKGASIRFWTESAWDREREKVREEAKKVLSSVFSSFDTDISMDLLSGRNARKTGSDRKSTRLNSSH